MQFITEAIIDEKADTLGSSKDFAPYIQSLQKTQPALLAYLFSPSFDMLTQEEREYMMFLALIIWSCVVEIYPAQQEVTANAIEMAEEKNWQLIEAQKVKSFREKLNVFFEKYPQEDLLAFVEDGLTDDEDDIITNEGRTYVFIALKTMIDCLQQTVA